ncbi:nucleoside phosphorylase [Bulleidia sp. zg-1006]|uniref:nucleoside phosphorylase n=1 Tax=Bulleidia sp. zg-1006 TaxID=2806552 RepID=UPI001939D360|nr:nucleoside phosphorylase [Bulleidia sp. zg-1006]QRG86250.1 nucleoside phosphorylase [Bulleidia sp. zg-1006]
MLEPHIHLNDTLQVKYAIMPGDPARLDRIKPYLENCVELAYNREFRSMKGSYKGVDMIAISTGIGGSSTAIAIEELKHIGVDTMIRIGSCGALQSDIQLGDLIFAQAAVRDDGTSKAYVDIRYPAVSDSDFLQACINVAKEKQWSYHVGIVHSHESFYADTNAQEEAQWSNLGILGADMETATLFTVGKLRHIKTMSILNNVVLWEKDTADSIGNYVDEGQKTMEGERREIVTALEAIYQLHQKFNGI